MRKLCIAFLALVLAVAVIHAQEPVALTAEEEVVRAIDDDLDLLNLGLPEFADLDEATNPQPEEADDSDLADDDEYIMTPDDDEDDDFDNVDDEVDDDEVSDVETIKKNPRGKWQRFREQRRQRGGRWGRRSNSTESDGVRGGKHRGRRPWRNQQTINNDEEQEGGERHHHRHRKNDDNKNVGHRRGRPGKHRHWNRRNRPGRHFHFNQTEAKRWESATWEQKVEHICGKLSRHQSEIESPQGRRMGGVRRRNRGKRMEFLGRMTQCCSEEKRESCFYHLRHKVCEERTSLQSLNQDLPQPVKVAFSRVRCCTMRGWRRHMCFSTPATNQSSEYATNEDPIMTAEEAQAQPPNMDLMLQDMPVVEVSNFDNGGDPIDETEDLGDIDDDLGDVNGDDEYDDVANGYDVEGNRRPHNGKKGHRGRHQGRHKAGRRMRMMWKRCCKAGRDEGRNVEADQEAEAACGDAATIYLQNVQQKRVCRKAYEKCCIRAATP